jgi:hypothetical protein
MHNPDRAPFEIAGKSYVVSVHRVLLSTFVPSGDSTQEFGKSHAFFEVQYANRRIGIASGPAAR